MRTLTDDEIQRCRLTLIGGAGYGHGVGLRVFLATTSPKDSLRPGLEAQAEVCEKVLAQVDTEGKATITKAESETIAHLLDE